MALVFDSASVVTGVCIECTAAGSVAMASSLDDLTRAHEWPVISDGSIGGWVEAISGCGLPIESPFSPGHDSVDHE